MKKPNDRIPADKPLDFDLKGWALFPTILTLTIALAAFVTSLGGGPDSYQVAGFIVLLCAVVFYSVTFIVGGLCLLLGRFLRKLTGPSRGSLVPERELWDDSIDGP